MRCGSTLAAPSGVATEADLRRAVAIARQKGCAVAIGLIHPGSRVIGPVTHLPFVNADELAARHWPEAPDLHAYEASQLATSLPGCPPGSPPGPGDPNGTARPGSPQRLLQEDRGRHRGAPRAAQRAGHLPARVARRAGDDAQAEQRRLELHHDGLAGRHVEEAVRHDRVAEAGASGRATDRSTVPVQGLVVGVQVIVTSSAWLMLLLPALPLLLPFDVVWLASDAPPPAVDPDGVPVDGLPGCPVSSTPVETDVRFSLIRLSYALHHRHAPLSRARWSP